MEPLGQSAHRCCRAVNKVHPFLRGAKVCKIDYIKQFLKSDFEFYIYLVLGALFRIVSRSVRKGATIAKKDSFDSDFELYASDLNFIRPGEQVWFLRFGSWCFLFGFGLLVPIL
jgi:hypothetical protein